MKKKNKGIDGRTAQRCISKFPSLWDWLRSIKTDATSLRKTYQNLNWLLIWQLAMLKSSVESIRPFIFTSWYFHLALSFGAVLVSIVWKASIYCESCSWYGLERWYFWNCNCCNVSTSIIFCHARNIRRTKLTKQLLDQIFHSQQIHFQFHTLGGNYHNRIFFPYGSPPGQGIFFQIVMGLRVEVLCLFGEICQKSH